MPYDISSIRFHKQLAALTRRSLAMGTQVTSLKVDGFFLVDKKIY